MVSRKITGQRKAALIADLRDRSRRGHLVPGDMLPGIRELAEQYELSTRTVLQELQPWIESGHLRSVPRVGLFVDKPLEENSDLYLVVTPPTSRDDHDGAEAQPRMSSVGAMRYGFEHRVSELGATTITVPADHVAKATRAGALAGLVGAFDLSGGPADESEIPAHLHRVWYASLETGDAQEAEPIVDTIRFDDVAGGVAATEHLLTLGHASIAFIGHHKDQHHKDKHGAGRYTWSRRRADGWEQAMRMASCDPEGLLLLPDSAPVTAGDEVKSAAKIASANLKKIITAQAVVCANDRAALGLIKTLRRRKVTPDQWPAIVGFDDLPEVRANVMTSLRPPFAELGRTAADMLRTRLIDDADRPPRLVTVGMSLIQRISTQPEWSQDIESLALEHWT